MTNAEIANTLASFAQLLSAQKENPFKVKAYQRAATKIRDLPESLEDLVRDESDLTQFSGIGEGIASAVKEIVLAGSLSRLDLLRTQVTPEVASISQFPRLDPARVLRIYKKLGIASIETLQERLESGEIQTVFGTRMVQHLQAGFTASHTMLLYRADPLRLAVEEFLVGPCGADRAEVAGDYRRRLETIDDLVFLVETSDFAAVVKRMQRYGGNAPLVASSKNSAEFTLPAGIALTLKLASTNTWGTSLVAATGSKAHLRKLTALTGPISSLMKSPFPSETSLYEKFGLAYIHPELREGRDEVDLARRDALPSLVTVKDLRGELHAHSTSSDGSQSIEEMATAAKAAGYEYLGITDHSQSLKIANGVSTADLWKQIRYIDKLNERMNGIRILKSSEVDILVDGALDYPDELLKELDYTICSIHSRFALGKAEQTERILRAMDNRYFNILGHATGRLLLKRPGYEINLDRLIGHARENGCFFEINSSPDRLDLSAENARVAVGAGIKLLISTDAHSTRELGLTYCGVDQARRAGVEKSSVLNSLPWRQLKPLLQRS